MDRAAKEFVNGALATYGKVQSFKPCAYYEPEGDCFEFLFSNTHAYAKRLDRWVTVYYSKETDEIVGGLLKDIRGLLRKFPGLDIDIVEGQVKIACVLRAPAWQQGDPIAKKTYGDVIRRAEETGISAEYELV